VQRFAALTFLACVTLFACVPARARRAPAERHRRASALATPRAEVTAALATLRAEETTLRARTDFATLPPSSRSLGANPYGLAAVPHTTLSVGILRGDSRVVLLDDGFRELESVATEPSPSAVAVVDSGDVFVAGPLTPAVERFQVSRERLVPKRALPAESAVALRALAADERSVFAADFAMDRLFAWRLRAGPSASAVPAPTVTRVCGGPVRLALSPRFLAIDCLFDHQVMVVERDADGLLGRVVGRISHDGPLWSVALLELGDELFVAAGGVEDHPLERRDGVFGYVDSFVYVYSRHGAGELTQRGATNVSMLGVVTPKALSLELRNGVPTVFAVGYGSDVAVELPLDREPRRRRSLPGCAALLVTGTRRRCANPLFDAWVELGDSPRVFPARAAAAADPSARERLGEALFFTTLMAPDASSDGRLSRFTCETCHFEGGTDGRVHSSGRGAIRVSTRPLFGLFNDAPHFSRAHDRDLTSVCHNEFAVANRGNPIEPWFGLDPTRFAWLEQLGVGREQLSPVELRRALCAFLQRFTHEENPSTSGRASHFTAVERRGALAFRQRCAGCHAPRLVASDASTEVPFERWEELVFSAATPLVWARGDYAKTGVMPYVDPDGTRVPSLRRLYLKRPYLTNGSASTLADVLERVRLTPREFRHATMAEEPGFSSLPAEERADMLAFLRLL